MRRRKLALRGLVRGALSRALGRERARVAYDAASAARELAWNSWRRRLSPSFWRRAARDRRNGVVRYAIHGEFGDALLALPFLYQARRRLAGRRLEVVIKGSAAGGVHRSADDPLSEGRVRLLEAADGRAVNFLAEFWSRVPFVDRALEGNVSDPSEHYWQPQPAFTLQGESVGPSDYRPFLETLFTDDDRRLAEGLWSRSGRQLRVAAHLRRSPAEIAALVEELDRASLGPETAVAVLGSRRHQAVPDLHCRNVELLDLTDNYERGIGIMPLLQTLRTAHLFLGGRGGFELFALVSCTPAITVFDEDGWWERRRLWPQRLWNENPLGLLLEARDFATARVFDKHVAPWLRERARERAAEVGAPAS